MIPILAKYYKFTRVLCTFECLAHLSPIVAYWCAVYNEVTVTVKVECSR